MTSGLDRSLHPPPPEAVRTRSTGAFRPLLELPFLAALAVGIVVLVRLLLVQAFYIPSGSMLPQLQLQDKVVVSRLAYHLHPVHRGDIVVFDAPRNAHPERQPAHGGSALRRAARYVGERLGLTSRTDELIKRIIAVPGETVEAHDGHVFIDGRLLLEPYLPSGSMYLTSTFGPVTVPAGRVWVMGDFRTNSEDSRVFGSVPTHTIVGRAFLRIWPLTHLSFL